MATKAKKTTEKEVNAPVEEAPKTKKAAPKAKKETKTKEAPTKKVARPTIKSFDVIVKPVITEKTMALMQEKNQVTVKVLKTANKTEVKLAFEAIFQVKVENVRIINVRAKDTRRGGRYPGSIPGYKKAVVTVAEGEAIDLFKE